MNVLILSQYYTPEPIPKPVELASELKRNGHSVSVITGFPNYPSGKLYEGYRLRAIQQELIDDIPVTRTFELPYHGKNAVGRLLNYLSFMFSAPLGHLFTAPCDAIYVWHPPLSIGVAAWIIARLRRVPFIYDVQDIWPEEAVLSGVLKEGWLVKAMSYLEKQVYRWADHLLVVTEGARDNLIGKGVDPAKISVMPHWVDEKMFFEISQSTARHEVGAEYGWQEEEFIILFAGNIGLVQGLETVVRTAHTLREAEQIRLVLVGDGTDKSRLQLLAEELQVGHRLQFIDRLPMEKMPGLMAASDALLVHLKRSELSKYVIPTKTMAYLAAGKPILMGMDGAAAQLIEEAGAGMIVPPEDSQALAAAICDLAARPVEERNRMGENGRNYLKEHLTKQKVVAKYEDLLQRVAQRKK